MSIFDVQHQLRAQRILQLALAGGRLPHAYIFAGPEGVGRGMLARRFATMLLCADPRSITPPKDWAWPVGKKVQDACGTCPDCVAMKADTHPDFHLIDRQLGQHHPDPQVRARKGLELAVEVIRHFVLDRATLRPAQGRCKVFIIREADRMSVAAQNAMLKTLEEPPGTTYLILRSRSADRLLPTTRSRCQVVAFTALPAEFVEKQLIEQRELEPATARFVARYSEGRLGWALGQLDDGLLARRATVVGPLTGLDADSAIGLARVLQQEALGLGRAWAERTPDVTDTQALRAGLRGMLAIVASLFRDAVSLSLGRADQLANVDLAPAVRRLAERSGVEGLAACIEAVGRAESEIDRNANVQLALESLTIRLARALSPPAAQGAAALPGRGP